MNSMIGFRFDGDSQSITWAKRVKFDIGKAKVK
jgi:hypothetical protein